MLIYFIIILAIISRFIPHIPNFAPITAIAIFSAAFLPWKKAFGITLAARLVSDIFLGFFAWPLMVAVYGSHLVGILFGLWIKRSKDVIPAEAGIQTKGGHGSRIALRLSGMTNYKWFRIIASSLGASALFFFATNFAFLYSNYPHNLSGIIQSYINGLPFLRGTLMGDMFYSAALFGGYSLVKIYADKRHRASEFQKAQS